MKKKLVFAIALFAVSSLFIVSGVQAQDKGPDDITLVSPSAKKPSLFPHAKHQENIACAECHHLMADKKQVPFEDGAKVEKCASCHNTDTLGGVTYQPEGFKKPLKLDTYKGAGHGNCLACHKKMAKEDPALKAKKIDKCSACHPKKK